MARDPQRVGLTPYERDLLQGMVYVLCDSRAEDPFSHVIGVFDSPTKAIEVTHTDPGLWHHYCEHYWMGNGDRWEITPYMLNSEVEWKRKEWDEARPRVHPGPAVVYEPVGTILDWRRAKLAEISPDVAARLDNPDV